MKKYLTSVYRTSSSSNKVFIITTSAHAEDIVKRLTTYPEWSFEVSGIALMDKIDEGGEVLGIPIIAGNEELYEQFRTKVVDEIFIHLPN